MRAAYKVVFTDEYLEEAQRIGIAQNPTLRLLYQSRWFRWVPRILLLVALILLVEVRLYWDAAFTAGCLLLMLLLPTYNRWSLARVRRRNRARGNESNISMDEGGLELVSLHSRGRTEWAGVIRAILYSNGVLLELQPRRFVWLPDQCLNEGSADDVRSLITSHVQVRVTVDHPA